MAQFVVRQGSQPKSARSVADAGVVAVDAGAAVSVRSALAR
jgi:hypothetical protein